MAEQQPLPVPGDSVCFLSLLVIQRRFGRNLEEQKWDRIQASINQAIKDIFAAAIVKSQPEGLGIQANPPSNGYIPFSIYGVDVMLKGDFQPVIIEVNFSPDCTRACKYDPEFFNNILTVVEPRSGDLDKAFKDFTVL